MTTSAASTPGTPWWVTLVVGVGGLLGVLVTLVVTSRGEKARSEEETKRQEMRLQAEESRLLNLEARAAISAFLGVATAFEHVSRSKYVTDDAIREREDAIQDAVADLDLALARVQVTCSVKVAGMASHLGMTAQLFEMHHDETTKRSEVRLQFLSRHHDLVRAIRDELGINEPPAGEERSKSWLVTGRAEPEAEAARPSD